VQKDASAFSQRSDADSAPFRQQNGRRSARLNSTRQMPGRHAFLPGIATCSGRNGYPRKASIMPGNLFMFHYRVFAAPSGDSWTPKMKLSETF
jgi:hypothetical protein